MSGWVALAVLIILVMVTALVLSIIAFESSSQRGPRGKTGVGTTGPSGSTGSTGSPSNVAGATGATGTQGPTGGSSISAYGAATNSTGIVMSNKSLVHFNDPPFYPNLNLTVPTQGGTIFTIIEPGSYFYSYVAAGVLTGGAPIGQQIIFNLDLDGNPATGSMFFGQSMTYTGSQLLNCVGSGLLSLNSGDIIGLQNSSGFPVILEGGGSVNASLSLQLL